MTKDPPKVQISSAPNDLTNQLSTITNSTTNTTTTTTTTTNTTVTTTQLSNGDNKGAPTPPLRKRPPRLHLNGTESSSSSSLSSLSSTSTTTTTVSNQLQQQQQQSQNDQLLIDLSDSSSFSPGLLVSSSLQDDIVQSNWKNLIDEQRTELEPKIKAELSVLIDVFYQPAALFPINTQMHKNLLRGFFIQHLIQHILALVMYGTKEQIKTDEKVIIQTLQILTELVIDDKTNQVNTIFP